MRHLEIVTLLIVCLTNNGSCLLQGLYCGTENCYEGTNFFTCVVLVWKTLHNKKKEFSMHKNEVNGV